MSTIILIPARGGSKRIPRKNLAELAPNVTLLSNVVGKALQLGPPVYVSTEDAEIAAHARECGALVHDRQPELASDEATLEDLLACLFASKPEVRAIVTLQCTSPFAPVEVYQRLYAWASAEMTALTVSFQALPFAGSPSYRTWYPVGRSRRLPRPRTQDLLVPVDSGAGYSTIRVSVGRAPRGSKFVRLSKRQALDIDVEEDLEYARYLYAKGVR